ncbi:hypothetical protein ACFX2A_024519 [Malus domestica]
METRSAAKKSFSFSKMKTIKSTMTRAAEAEALTETVTALTLYSTTSSSYYPSKSSPNPAYYQNGGVISDPHSLT